MNYLINIINIYFDNFIEEKKLKDKIKKKNINIY
jgi:hypothetical protein